VIVVIVEYPFCLSGRSRRGFTPRRLPPPGIRSNEKW
jgi:hypothetical protein